MASDIRMPEPVCLIENSQTKGLAVHQEALQVLSEITQPVVVVAITGLYRTGKSYLMNRLAGQRKGEGGPRPAWPRYRGFPARYLTRLRPLCPAIGFSLGSGVQSHTKGIWMWCVPHPCQPEHTLVLLDTEGLGDVEKVWKKQKLPLCIPSTLWKLLRAQPW